MKKIPALIILFIIFTTPANSEWNEHQSAEYVDLVNNKEDFRDTEIILRSRHGAGTDHYIEWLRIYKDSFPELALIFECRTLDRYSDASLSYEIVSEVTFGKQYKEGDLWKTDIIVKSKKIHYEHDMKTVVSEEILGKTIFKWNGRRYAPSTVD